MMKLYHYKNCTTCKKALRFVSEQGTPCEIIAIDQNPPTKKELGIVLAKYQGNIRKLFNTSGKMYRSMNLKEKMPSMNEVTALDLLSQEGMLVKRPLLVTKQGGLVGFNEAEWQEFFS